MGIMNAVRSGYTSVDSDLPLEPWPAGSLEEAWTFLKRERGIELWLEGRRVGDLLRWAAAGTPGAPQLPDGKSTVSGQFVDQPDLCRPIPLSERLPNPNVPDSP